jgi:hypothetical protein
MDTRRPRRNKKPSLKVLLNNTGQASGSDDSPERSKRKRGKKDASGNPSANKDTRREAAGIHRDLSQPTHLSFSDEDGGLSLPDFHDGGVGGWLSQDVLSHSDSSIPPQPPSVSSTDLDAHLQFDFNSDASAASKHTLQLDPNSDASCSEHTVPFDASSDAGEHTAPFDVDSDVSVWSMPSSLDVLLFGAPAGASGADGQDPVAGKQKSASVEQKADGVAPGPVVVEEKAASVSAVDLLRTHPSDGPPAHNQRLMPHRRAVAANPVELMAQHQQNALVAAGSQPLDDGKESRPLLMSRDTTAPLKTALDLPIIIHSVIGVMFERCDVDAPRKSNRVAVVGKAKSAEEKATEEQRKTITRLGEASNQTSLTDFSKVVRFAAESLNVTVTGKQLTTAILQHLGATVIQCTKDGFSSVQHEKKAYKCGMSGPDGGDCGSCGIINGGPTPTSLDR